MITKMLKDGIIRPSRSPFALPMLLVWKKDDTWHFYVDYRVLNSIIVRDTFLIPTIDELFGELHGSRFFTKLQLHSNFHQTQKADDSNEAKAFRMSDGHFELNVMPFGLTNAPSTFQATMNGIFDNHLYKFVPIFFDDILVYNPAGRHTSITCAKFSTS